ncbi:MAG: hypothetical protein MUF27_06075 [Acidobacteria bacterium]|jgi:hypothetical protein|nr:hypothetical protein [Acidobacteriota bacterium]
MRTSRIIRTTAAAAAGLVLVELLAAPLALAIVGAPLTPVSVAGVGRRTTRRTVVVAESAAASSAAATQTAAANQAAAQSAAAASQSAAASAAAAQSAAATAQAASSKTTGPAATPAGGAALASLPEGCVAKGEVFQCGNATYKPYVQGGAIVYVPVGG